MKTHFLSLKNYKTVFLLGVIAIIAVCCKSTQNTATTKSPLEPAASDVAIAGAHWQGTTMDNLNQGYALFSNKCTECHGIKNPQDFTEAEWNNIMPGMGRKAGLDTTQYKLVFHYILTKREALLGPGK